MQIKLGSGGCGVRVCVVKMAINILPCEFVWLI